MTQTQLYTVRLRGRMRSIRVMVSVEGEPAEGSDDDKIVSNMVAIVQGKARTGVSLVTDTYDGALLHEMTERAVES